MAFPSLSSRASVRLPSSHKPHAGQISPNKFMISRCTTAAFTLSRVPLGFVVMCQLAPGLSLLCSFCSSARTFALGLPSDHSSRNRPCLRLVVMFPFQVLPQGTLTPSDHAHVGRTQRVPADGAPAAGPAPRPNP